MKRWVSVLIANAILVAVATTGIFAVVKSNVANFNSYASPIITNSSTASSVTPASAPIKDKNLNIVSFNPTISLSFASWNTVDNNSKDAKRALQIVNEELSKYSQSMLDNLGLKKIYLVTSLKVDGIYRSGMPEAQFEDALYFDVAAKYFTSENGDYIRRTIHHELRHLTDFNSYATYRPDDNNWTSCNVTSAKYGTSGASMYNNVDYAHAKHPKVGFITGYATSGIDEDRAEVFAYYMTDKNYLYKTALDDASLSCKIAQTEKLVKTL